MKNWEDMSEREKDTWISENIMGWKPSYGGNVFNDGGLYVAIPFAENMFRQTKFRPTTNSTDAMKVANKLGIALIPQSDGEKFRWYACDVYCIHYRGTEIAIEDKNDSGVSEDNLANAICHAAYLSIMNKQ